MNNSPINSTINSTTVGELADATSLIQKFERFVMNSVYIYMLSGICQNGDRARNHGLSRKILGKNEL